MSAEAVTSEVIVWAKDYDSELYAHLSKDIDYTTKIFAIGRNDAKPRKDLAKWNEVRDYVSFFFDELFEVTEQMPDNVKQDVPDIIRKYISIYDENDDSAEWFEKLKTVATELGYAEKPKDYKKNPEMYKGHVGDISMVLRIAVSGKSKSPDLYSIMQILGKDRVIARLESAI